MWKGINLCPITIGVRNSSDLCVVSIVCFMFLFLKELLKYSTVSITVSVTSCPGFHSGFLEKVNIDQ